MPEALSSLLGMTHIRLSSINAQGRGVEVRFQRLADRWAHTVAAVAGGRLMPLLASAEGGPDDDWPPSPPVQEVHLQEEGQKNKLILGVGGAGSARWSLSVEADAAEGRLLFDVACRLSLAPPRCRSSYRSMLAAKRGRSLHSVLLPVEKAAVAVTALPLSGHSPADVEITPDGLFIVPDTADLAVPASVRWSYSIGPAEHHPA